MQILKALYRKLYLHKSIDRLITKAECSVIRLCSHKKFIHDQRLRLHVVGLYGKAVFDHQYRNCAYIGGKRTDDGFLHSFRILDLATVYKIVLLNDQPVDIETNQFSEAIDTILLEYWRMDIIAKYPVIKPGDASEPPGRIKPPEPVRRPLTETEQRIRESWAAGKICDETMISEDFSAYPDLVNWETMLEITEVFEHLRKSELYVASCYNGDTQLWPYWSCWGGSSFEIDDDHEDPDKDYAYYKHTFIIEQPNTWKITMLDEDIVNIPFKTFREAADFVIEQYSRSGLIEPKNTAQ